MNGNKFGFTLAGMIIVLAMIGAFFVLTIPVLKSGKNTDDTQPSQDVKQVSYQTLLQKAYSDLNMALVALPADYNCNDLACTGLFGTNQTSQAIGDALSKHLGVIKICGTAPNTGCFSNSVKDKSNGTTKLNADEINDVYKMVTNTGMSLLIKNYANNCAPSSNNMDTCGYIYVDVNGTQMPNAFGEDIFYFYITNSPGNFIYPTNGIATPYVK